MSLVPFKTLLRREVHRFLKLFSQTIIPPAITALLFILIFGYSIGSRITSIDGVSYMEYIIPGLLMMGVITSAYAHTSTSLFLMKFQGNIQEILITPMSYMEVVLAMNLGGIVRGLIVGSMILIIALLFSPITILHAFYLLFFVLLVSLIFSCAGFLTALWAENFDQLNIFITFLITPLIYLGGVFYSINMLPPFWSNVSHFNPVLYMVNGVRYGFIGLTDVPLASAVSLVVALAAVSFGLSVYLFKKGYSLKS